MVPGITITFEQGERIISNRKCMGLQTKLYNSRMKA